MVNKPAGMGVGAGKFLGVQRIFARKTFLRLAFSLTLLL